jgi:hypothetical protein
MAGWTGLEPAINSTCSPLKHPSKQGFAGHLLVKI